MVKLRHIKHYIAVALLLILVDFQANAQPLKVTVKVDRTPILTHETFRLIVEANEELPRWAFDSSPLLKYFIVGETSVETTFQLHQNKREQTTRWVTRLTAKKAGTYTIPSFTVEGYKTQPLTLEVIAPQTTEKGTQRSAYLEGELSTDTAYLGQQILYQARLYIDAQLPIQGGSIIAPELEQATIELLTQSKERQEIINGTRYRVFEQNYAITPEEVGHFELTGAYFEGYLGAATLNGLIQSRRSEEVSVYAPDSKLQVQPIPSNFPGQWFVSEAVILDDEWDSDRIVFPIGEPIHRKITLSAASVNPHYLPEINPEIPAELRVYPERPHFENRVKDNLRVSQAEYRFVYIPSRTGTVELPEIRIPWFNSQTNQVEYALIPAKEISLIQPPGSQELPTLPNFNQPNPQINTNLDNKPESPEEALKQATPNEHAPTGLANTRTNSLYFYLMLVFLFLWLLTLLCFSWALFKKKEKPRPADSHLIPLNAREALNQLKQACDKNQAQAAWQALQMWQKTRLTSPHNTATLPTPLLPTLNNSLSSYPKLIHEVNVLEQVLFSSPTLNPERHETWTRGKALWAQVAHCHEFLQSTSKQSRQTLYPNV